MSKSNNTAKSARKAAPAKAKPAKNPDLIVSNINDSTGAHIVVTSAAGATISYPRYGDDKQRRALSGIGNSLKALQADLKARPPVKPQAQMARGTDAHTAPHSAKAVADQRAAAAKGGKAAKTSAPKAAKAKQPSRGADRDYTRGKTAIAAKPDSWRHHMLTVITKHGNTAKAKAAHEKSGKFSGNKLDFNWAAAQGYITFAK